MVSRLSRKSTIAPGRPATSDRWPPVASAGGPATSASATSRSDGSAGSSTLTRSALSRWRSRAGTPPAQAARRRPAPWSRRSLRARRRDLRHRRDHGELVEVDVDRCGLIADAAAGQQRRGHDECGDRGVAPARYALIVCPPGERRPASPWSGEAVRRHGRRGCRRRCRRCSCCGRHRRRGVAVVAVVIGTQPDDGGRHRRDDPPPRRAAEQSGVVGDERQTEAGADPVA